MIFVYAEVQKAVDLADISVLFFGAGANFWAMHARTSICAIPILFRILGLLCQLLLSFQIQNIFYRTSIG